MKKIVALSLSIVAASAAYSEIKIIEPNAVDKILIQDGRELLTLMTCHPPNSGGRFRYLVICERAKESAPP